MNLTTNSSDADYTSVSGTVVALGGAAVSRARNTQRCVTLSTAEAEYVALGEGGFVHGRGVIFC